MAANRRQIGIRSQTDAAAGPAAAAGNLAGRARRHPPLRDRLWRECGGRRAGAVSGLAATSSDRGASFRHAWGATIAGRFRRCGRRQDMR
jgi:hypothetical protein